MSKRAVIYARVSYDDRKNEDRNLEGQIEDGRAYCQEKGYRIVAELAEDDRGASGADWDLPKLNEALDMARAGEADVLVTRELDRFARGLAKQLVVEGEFKRYEMDVEYILGEYPDTPEGNLMKNVRAVIAEYERLKINERMVRGRRLAVKQGRVFLHGVKAPPYGYRLENGVFVIYEPEARVVRLIFTWYVIDGLTYGKIVRRLNEMKVPTWSDTHGSFARKRGHGQWGESVIRGILTNETYAGVWHYGKVNTKAGKMNSREHWLAIEVPAIVSRELWEKAQERRAYNKAMAKRNTDYEYLVGRRVVCAECGSKMVGCSKRGRRGELRLYYKCQGYRLVCKCTMTTYFRAGQVDTAVWNWIKDLLLSPEALRQNLEKQQAEQEEANQLLHDRLAMIDNLLTDNQGQLERLIDLYLSGDFGKEMLTERKIRLENTIKALDKERGDLVTTLEARTLSDDQIMNIEDFARKVAGGLVEAETDFATRRQIIDLLDVQVTLAIEDSQKVAYVRCLVDETKLPIEPTISSFEIDVNKQ